MIVGLNIFGAKLSHIAPIRVFNARVLDVVFERSVRIAHAAVKPIDVVLVFHQVEVDTNPSIRRACGVSQVGHRISVVGLS